MSKELTITKRSGVVTIWSYDDDKLDFDSWVRNDPSIADRWQAACIELNSSAGDIFAEWAVYASAQEK